MASYRVLLTRLTLTSALMVSAAGGAEFAWVPVDASGSHTIVGNEIILPSAGQAVTLELHLFDWDPEHEGDPLLAAYQATIDSTGYSGGAGVPLNPLGWPGSPEDGAFIDVNHIPPAYPVEYVFSDFVSIPVVATPTLDYEYGSVIMSDEFKEDDGAVYYGGTLILEVPYGAQGAYPIGFTDTPTKTFMRDPDAAAITPINVTPGLVTVVCPCDGDVNGNGVVTMDDIMIVLICASGDDPPDPWTCDKADVDCNGVIDLVDYGRVICIFQDGEDCCGSGVLYGACLNDDEDFGPCALATEWACTESLDGTYLGDGTICPIDCNNNGIDDECDLDCEAQEGACNVPGCGESEDCNNNGVPDECDLDDGTLCDVDEDGEPDQCEVVCAECNPLDMAGVDATGTGAAFKIVMVDTSEARIFEGLSDPGTVFGRSNPHEHGSPADGGADIAGAGEEPYPDTLAQVGDCCAVPPEFPEDPALGQEIHIEFLSLELTDGAGAYVRAGQAFHDSVEGDGRPELYRNSHGEAQGMCIDFPADSFFNLFVEIDLGDRSPKLYNMTPIVIRAQIPSFPLPPGSQPEDAFIYDPSFPAVSLFDADGVHRAYLVTLSFGDEDLAELPPSSCEAQPAIQDPLSFAVDEASVGVLIRTPNDVYLDAQSAEEVQVNLYVSSGGTPGAAPDTTNGRVLTGNVGGEGEFDDEDAINSLSLGRDGTVNLFSRWQSPVLFFSVDQDSEGEGCTDVWHEATAGRDQAAADVYNAVIEQDFGSYDSPMSPVCPGGRKNCLVTDQSTLGLAPAMTEAHRDDLTALEVAAYIPEEFAYMTFSSSGAGMPFWGKGANIYAYHNPTMGAFEPENFEVDGLYATAADLGLQTGDEIDALAVSDITPGEKVCVGDGAPCTDDYDCIGHGMPERCVEKPDGVWNAGDEVLFSLAPGSSTLMMYELSAADVFYVAFGDLYDPHDPAHLYVSAAGLGLLDTDNVDAIDVSPGFGRKDCDNNGIADQCDIDRGVSRDDNNNSIPDKCEDKNRYISFDPACPQLAPETPGQPVALRVELTASLYFGGSRDETWWVQEPEEWEWDTVPPITEYLAYLGCTPKYRDDWDSVPFLHVGDREIVPAAIYTVQSTPDGIAFSDPGLRVLTVTRPHPKWWADIVGYYDGEGWTRPNGVVNMDDVMAAVMRFVQHLNAPEPTVVDVDPEVPNRVINFTDIFWLVQAFKGEPYPFRAPERCSP